MVRYALQHIPGSHRMYNPENKKIVVCDNISWSKTKQWRAPDGMKKLLDENEIEAEQVPDATPIVVVNNIPDHNNDSPPSAIKKSTRGKRMLRELATSYNDISDLRVTGDINVNPVRITYRESS